VFTHSGAKHARSRAHVLAWAPSSQGPKGPVKAKRASATALGAMEAPAPAAALSAAPSSSMAAAATSAAAALTSAAETGKGALPG
jgi:hypothetical protein